MSDPHATSWSLLAAAGRGDADHRRRFAEIYGPLVARFLRARASGRAAQELEDVVQEVFVECYRDGGVLQRIQGAPPRSFRAFLFGVVKNVTRKVEHEIARSRERPAGDALPEPLDGDGDLSERFEREWARAMVAEALRATVRERMGTEHERARVAELLRWRFEEGVPIRDVARRWNEDPARVHHLYAGVRARFHAKLREVVSFHEPGARLHLDHECRRLLDSLG